MGVVFHCGAGDFVLQKRCFSPEIYFRGYWSIFGGLIEPGESAETAARRALEEELDLTFEGLSPLLDMRWGAEVMGDGRPRL